MEALANRPETLGAAVAEAEARYVAANPNSQQRYRAAREVLGGGNTRSILYYPPFPLVIERAEGQRLWDLDGHEYVDFAGEYSAGLFGHSNPLIRDAVRQALEDGIVLCAPNIYEVELARAICGRFPSIDMVRFCNSGTEANLLAIGTARAATGRDRILVFEGGYHGGVLMFGPGGSPLNVPFPYVVAQYNDADAACQLIREHASSLAAVLVEPMMGSAGCIPAELEFLQAVRQSTAEEGVVLIFDEVMTSRLSPGGLQAATGVTPDITTLGKYLGGGMSFGAFGGSSQIMSLFDPERPGHLFHAGTFNNNVCSMAGGLTGLTKVFTPEAALRLTQTGDDLRTRLNRLADARGLAVQITGCGSLMNVHFLAPPIRTPCDAAKGDKDLRRLLHFDLMRAGFYMTPRGYITLSLPLTESDLDAFAAAFEEFLDRHGHLMAC